MCINIYIYMLICVCVPLYLHFHRMTQVGTEKMAADLQHATRHSLLRPYIEEVLIVLLKGMSDDVSSCRDTAFKAGLH